MFSSVELTDAQFRKVSNIVYRNAGINLKAGKEALVRARLMKRMRALRLDSIEEYMALIESREGIDELNQMIDAMTTNKTSFFREIEHFNFLREKVLPRLDGPRLRFWSAACSSGEEPYSLAILLRESIPGIDRRDVRILATDISMQMLEKARRGVYSAEVLRVIQPQMLQKHFVRIGTDRPGIYQVAGPVRALVHLAWLNLMEKWPMKGPFDVIFCRNVMIYFDRETQQRLIDRFWNLIAPGGFLLVGHSEGLSAINHRFKYIRPATYRK